MARLLGQVALTTLILVTTAQEIDWNWSSMSNIILESPQGFGTAEVDGKNYWVGFFFSYENSLKGDGVG